VRIAEAVLGTIGAARDVADAREAPVRTALVDRALVLSADHELNASTFAVRVAASAGADLYACVAAGIATLSGPLHGGESDRLEALLRVVSTPGRARAVLRAHIERGDRLPGFGHALYPAGDPRAPPLLDAARALAPRATRTLDAVIDEVRRTLGLEANIDAGLVAVARALGAPGTGSAIFAVGRIAGWVAHVLEQRDAGFLLRPRARYVGPPDQR
jgi:citrate synthase